MGAVKRTHKRAVLRQKFRKYAKRDPERAIIYAAELLRDILPEIIKKIIDVLPTLMKEVERLIIDGETSGEPKGFPDMTHRTDQTGWGRSIDQIIYDEVHNEAEN